MRSASHRLNTPVWIRRSSMMRNSSWVIAGTMPKQWHRSTPLGMGSRTPPLSIPTLPVFHNTIISWSIYIYICLLQVLILIFFNLYLSFASASGRRYRLVDRNLWPLQQRHCCGCRSSAGTRCQILYPLLGIPTPCYSCIWASQRPPRNHHCSSRYSDSSLLGTLTAPC